MLVEQRHAPCNLLLEHTYLGPPAQPTDGPCSPSGATLVAIALAVSDPGRIAWVRTFFVIFGAPLIQALPFVMIGATAAALVEAFVPNRDARAARPVPSALQLPAAALAGVAFPICECGSVPVARGLM